MNQLYRINKTTLCFKSDEEPYKIILNDVELASSSSSSLCEFENPKPSQELVYKVVYENHTEYIKERLLTSTGVVNFRDIGGYFTSDKRQVKYGCFYRSAPLTNLSQEHKTAIDALKLKVILDLRSQMECKNNEDYIPSGPTYVHASGIKAMDAQLQGNFDFSSLMKQADMTMLKEYIKKIYGELPIQNDAYKQMMTMLVNEEVPIVFHCSAGKDRTGFAAALILLTLGVDEETVMQDYLLSNEYRKQENDKIFANAQKEQLAMEALMCVFPEYLAISLQRIKDVYGTFEEYLLKEFQIDKARREELQKKYLFD